MEAAADRAKHGGQKLTRARCCLTTETRGEVVSCQWRAAEGRESEGRQWIGSGKWLGKRPTGTQSGPLQGPVAPWPRASLQGAARMLLCLLPRDRASKQRCALSCSNLRPLVHVLVLHLLCHFDITKRMEGLQPQSAALPRLLSRNPTTCPSHAFIIFYDPTMQVEHMDLCDSLRHNHDLESWTTKNGGEHVTVCRVSHLRRLTLWPRCGWVLNSSSLIGSSLVLDVAGQCPTGRRCAARLLAPRRASAPRSQRRAQSFPLLLHQTPV